MIIKKIEMYNFRQYIGNQTIEFSTDPNKNVTVLIGVNTSGKTTIIRAFEWCLYGKNGFDDPILLNSDVRKNMHEGDKQKVEVAVTFVHDTTEYTVTRTHEYYCNNRDSSGKEIEVSLNKKPVESLRLERLQSDGQTKIPVDTSNINDSIDRVLPKDLSDYFFFGGERVSGIANRTDLTKAVRGLMKLDVLENSRDHLTLVYKKFNSMIDTTGDANAQRAKDKIESSKQRKSILEEQLVDATKEVDYWNQKEREIDAELSRLNVEQIKKAKAERDRLDETIEREYKHLEAAKENMVNEFNQRPYAYFGMPAINKALVMLDTVKEETEGVPGIDQDVIDYLINRGTCICGTDLTKQDHAFDCIMSLRRVSPPEKIGTIVNNFKNKAEGYLAGSEGYYERIEDKYKSIREIKQSIGIHKDERDEQTKLINTDVDAKSIEEKRKNALAHYHDAQQEVNNINSEIGACDKDIKDCEEIIERFAKSSSKNRKVANYLAYSEEILKWINDKYSEKETTVRRELQDRVNKNFSAMYHGKRSIIIDDKYRVKYSDIKTEESDGLKAVKSFAFIAALVSMAKDKILDDSDMKLGQVYPLVMDAPFSNVDEIHIDNICKILPKTANQVIMAVMQKDWEYAEKNLDQYVGKCYSIKKDTDRNGKEIDTSTHIYPDDK